MRPHALTRLIRSILALSLALLTVPLLTLSSAHADDAPAADVTTTEIIAPESPPKTPSDPPAPEPPAPADEPPAQEPVSDEPASDGAPDQASKPGDDAVGPADGPADDAPPPDDSKQDPAALTAQGDTFALAAIPATGAGEAVITVKVGGDRTGDSAVSNLAGVQLGLFANETGGVALFTCTSDVDGDCNFVIPDTGADGANEDKRYWVRGIAVPGGWFASPTLRTGGSGNAPSNVTPYAFRTGEDLQAGNTYYSGYSGYPDNDFMTDTSGDNAKDSGGVWQQSRTNPVLPDQCGLDVALVLDLSGSVGPNLDDLKDASDKFVDSLVGTPSRMALFSFGASSPAGGAGANAPGLVPVTSQAQANAFKGTYAGWNAGGGTNWDRGLWAAAQGPTYDLVIVLTDGNPTVWGANQGNSSTNMFRDIETGVFSANAIKAEKTRVIGFGVGAGVSDNNTELNLRSISGGTEFTGGNAIAADYYQTANFDAAGDALRALALATCKGTLTVVKREVPSGTTGEDKTGHVGGGAGWSFSADGTNATTTGDGTNAVSFEFNDTTVADVAETAYNGNPIGSTGYELVTSSGKNAVCTNLNTGNPASVTNDGAFGFQVTVPDLAAISCTVYNRQSSASVEVDKTWIVNGTTYPHGQQPGGLGATLLLSGQNTPAFGTEYDGYSSGGKPSINENTSGTDLCRVSSRVVTEANGQPTNHDLAGGPFSPTLKVGSNHYTITNTATCLASLTLTKAVDNGPAAASAWTLTAGAPNGALAGPSGPTGVNGNVTAGATYTLSESGGDPRYDQVGAWSCTNGVQVTGGNKVSLAPGATTTCTVHNATGVLILKKQVQNTNGGSAVPGDFMLIANPATIDAPNLTTPGSAGGQSFFVDPSETFALSETGVSGYTLSSLVCSNGDNPASVQVDAGQTVTCTFTNTSAPGQLMLNKVVDPNNTGDTTLASAWLLTAAGVDVANPLISGQGTASGSTKAGTYQLDESGPATHTEGDWDCNVVGGGDAPVSPSDRVVVGVGQHVVCTITNTAIQPQLTLDKEVDHNGTGDETSPNAFQLTATPVGIAGQAPFSGPGGASAVVKTGTYGLSESSMPGYAPRADGWVCVNKTNNDAPVAVNAQNRVAVGLGMHVSCTIWNVAKPSKWTVSKASDPASGGTVLPGQAIDYELTLTKVGDGVPVEGVTVTDTLTGVQDGWVTGLPTQAASPDSWAVVSGGVITWHVAEIGNVPLKLAYKVTVGPDAWDATIANHVTPGPVPCVDQADVDCDETVHHTPHYTLDKAVAHPATPGDGDALVEPGERLEYTLTVTNDTEHAVVDALIEDDLSDILDDATMVTTTSELAAQGATLTGTTLTWSIEDLGPGDTIDATYVVQVKPGAWGATLHNVATPEPDTGGECIPAGDVPGGGADGTDECETTSTTPPVTTLLVEKRDAETGDVLGGAGFTLFLDANNAGDGACSFATPPVVEAGDTAVGPEEFTDNAGHVRFEELQKGCYILRESTTPAGFEKLDPKPTMGIDLTGNLFIAGGQTAAVVFTNVAEGNVQVVAKQQFELIGGNWVPSDGVVDYGDQVKYKVHMAVTGPKKFHDITVTDFLPGYSPEDTKSTLKSTLVPGSAVCIGTLTCTVSLNAETQLITWDIGDVDPDVGETLSTTAEMVVNFPELADNRVPAPGATVSDTLWNVGYLHYGVFTGLPVVARGGARMAMAAAPDPGVTMFSLRSNEVLVTASLTTPAAQVAAEAAGPGKKPAAGLPQTGAPAGLFPLGVLGGLLVAGGLALTRRTRKE